MPRRSAFTLIEVTIVMLVLGILAGAAAPQYFRSLDFYRAEAAACRLAADLRYARDLAVRTSSLQEVVFDVAGDRYELSGAKDLSRQTESYSVRLAADGYAARISAAEFTAGGATTTSVVFDQFGRTSATGKVVVAAGESARYLALSESGEITVSREP